MLLCVSGCVRQFHFISHFNFVWNSIRTRFCRWFLLCDCIRVCISININEFFFCSSCQPQKNFIWYVLLSVVQSDSFSKLISQFCVHFNFTIKSPLHSANNMRCSENSIYSMLLFSSYIVEFILYWPSTTNIQLDYFIWNNSKLLFDFP